MYFCSHNRVVHFTQNFIVVGDKKRKEKETKQSKEKKKKKKRINETNKELKYHKQRIFKNDS